MGNKNEDSNMVTQEVWVSAAARFISSGVLTTNQVDIGQALSPEVLRTAGAVSLEWSKLDYVMRVACKRLEHVDMTSEDGRKIMAISGHGEIVCRLCKAVAACSRLNDESKRSLNELIATIGKGRNDGLYGRRNLTLHSWWATNEQDAWLGRRVGTKEWCKPVQVSDGALKELPGKTRKAWEELLDLTKALLDATEQDSQQEANTHG